MGIATLDSAAPSAPERIFRTLRPGRLPYPAAVALQEEILERRPREDGDILILLEHPPVVTLGRRSRGEHLLWSEAQLQARGISVAEAGRGGDVTYHGPGQLVGYPIVDLAPRGRDLHGYLRCLEEVLIETLAAFGLAGERITGKTGVWSGGEKIASIGVGVRRWIAWHGFALNVSADLSGFDAIVPCGLPGVSMTSMERLLGRPVSLPELEAEVARSFARVFAARHAGEFEWSYDNVPQKARLA